MRLVLDSNVWLDWLHFNDPRVRALKQARSDNAVEIVIDQPCRDELVRVLGYDRFGLDQASRNCMLEHADRLSTLLAGLTYLPAARLPSCTDPDDVKFLALAQASHADWLITKDNALLRPRRRGSVGFRIGTPQQWALSEPATSYQQVRA
jgi:putative PIN family toxin of toxin-antitoxin system